MLVPWFLMDTALYGIGLFTPTILRIIDIGGESPSGIQPWLAKDIRSTEGALALDLFLVIGFVIAILMIDRWGRLALQKVGFLGMAAGLLIVAVGAAGGEGNENLVLILGGFAIFSVLVNAGPNSTTWTLPSELFPTSLRGSASGLAAASGKLGAAVGIFLLPVLADAWGLTLVMIAVAGISVLGFLVTAFFGAGLETSGRALESAGEGTGAALAPPQPSAPRNVGDRVMGSDRIAPFDEHARSATRGTEWLRAMSGPSSTMPCGRGWSARGRRAIRRSRWRRCSI